VAEVATPDLAKVNARAAGRKADRRVPPETGHGLARLGRLVSKLGGLIMVWMVWHERDTVWHDSVDWFQNLVFVWVRQGETGVRQVLKEANPVFCACLGGVRQVRQVRQGGSQQHGCIIVVLKQ
jgi:hypothetical protein